MKVLVILNQPPDPEGNAPGRCAVGLIRGLQAHGLDVRVLAARRDFAAGMEAPSDLPVEVVEIPPQCGGWRAWPMKLLRPRSELLAGSFPARVADAARDADVIHLEETPAAWSDLGLSQPSVVHLHYFARADRSLGPPWTPEFRDVLQFELAERAAIRRHRFLLASSPLIAAQLRRRSPRADVTLAPLALDPSRYVAASLAGPPVVGLIGTASWPPTKEAFRRLIQRVWPGIRREVPEARLLLAGRGTEALARDVSADGIEVVGEVPSAAEFLGGLSLLLFPLSRGSGMKVKALESLAMGLPVVTTAAGAEGIDGGDGVLVEENDDRLAQVAAELLRNPAALRERGEAARAAFLERYSPGPATRPLLDLYERMAGR